MSSLEATTARLEEFGAQVSFASSRPMTVLDHLRIPYEVDPALATTGTERLQCTGEGPALLWVKHAGEAVVAASVVGAHDAGNIPLFAAVADDDAVRPLLREEGGSWERARRIVSDDGRSLGSIWRRQDGSVLLPFDPCDVVENYWSERYLCTAQGQKARVLRLVLMQAYYRTRPMLPRSVQIWLRRRFARIQARSAFPRWPVETCLHDFFDLVVAILCGIAGGPIPRIGSWPCGYSWALVLTHDVEQAEGLAAMDPVLDLERRHGVRSCWNLVPRRYPIDPQQLSKLSAEGFEVGVHGLYHDGRDLESLATWQQRLPDARQAQAAWGASGFRSAALHRDWEWMRLLGGFDYDSSIPDTDPFEPQDGGCCTWLPFFNGDLVELPLTLPQDHTLFVILQRADETTWVDKADFLRRCGGMAMVDTHPDYLIDARILRAYDRFLNRFASDSTAWKALPRDVSAWWRRRAASSLEWEDGSWRVVGPAAGEARVEWEWRTW